MIYHPGIIPKLISGRANLAYSEANIISHDNANSNPPPNANLLEIKNILINFHKIYNLPINTSYHNFICLILNYVNIL